MYSVVLMMAMTSAPDAASFHKAGCHGGMLHKWNTCHGCYSTCHGCWSSGHGCGGSWAYSSYSCSGCAGNATYYFSCYGNQPNSYFQPFSCYGYGIYGGTSYTWPIPYEGGGAGTYGYGYPIPANSMPRIEKAPDTKAPDAKKPEIKEEKSMIYPTSPNKAQVVVKLPADAKLYANDQLTNLDSSERAFSTPALEKGLDYQYSMKIEYTRNGKTLTDNQIVKVRAGQVSVVDFNERVKAETAISTLKFVVPEGAKLFVENKPLSLAGSEFKTPELIKGAEYAYSIRAEFNRDGKNETQTQRVVFKAGEPVTVDFMDIGSIRTAAVK